MHVLNDCGPRVSALRLKPVTVAIAPDRDGATSEPRCGAHIGRSGPAEWEPDDLSF